MSAQQFDVLAVLADYSAQHGDPDDFVAARAAAEAALRQSGEAVAWRSMDSAPRDGTVILAELFGGMLPQTVRYRDRLGWVIAWDDYLLSERAGPLRWRSLESLYTAPPAASVQDRLAIKLLVTAGFVSEAKANEALNIAHGFAAGPLEPAAPGLVEALRAAHRHIDMDALRVSHCKDAALIDAALASHDPRDAAAQGSGS